MGIDRETSELIEGLSPTAKLIALVQVQESIIEKLELNIQELEEDVRKRQNNGCD